MILKTLVFILVCSLAFVQVSSIETKPYKTNCSNIKLTGSEVSASCRTPYNTSRDSYLQLRRCFSFNTTSKNVNFVGWGNGNLYGSSCVVNFSLDTEVLSGSCRDRIKNITYNWSLNIAGYIVTQDGLLNCVRP